MIFWALEQRRKRREKLQAEALAEGLAKGRAQGQAEERTRILFPDRRPRKRVSTLPYCSRTRRTDQISLEETECRPVLDAKPLKGSPIVSENV